MNPYWIIEENTFDEEAVDELVKIIHNRDIDYKQIELEPFVSTISSTYFNNPNMILIP